jgi:hypothetical protein
MSDDESTTASMYAQKYEKLKILTDKHKNKIRLFKAELKNMALKISQLEEEIKTREFVANLNAQSKQMENRRIESHTHSYSQPQTQPQHDSIGSMVLANRTGQKEIRSVLQQIAACRDQSSTPQGGSLIYGQKPGSHEMSMYSGDRARYAPPSQISIHTGTALSMVESMSAHGSALGPIGGGLSNTHKNMTGQELAELAVHSHFMGRPVPQYGHMDVMGMMLTMPDIPNGNQQIQWNSPGQIANSAHNQARPQIQQGSRR